MKGIILAGGKGSRLSPLTISVSKQLMPIYDKPMIYYPLSVLMLANIKEILLISTPQDLPAYQQLLGNGEAYGIKIHYKIQDRPEGLAQGLILSEDFVGQDNICMVLGDNVFYGHGFSAQLNRAKRMVEQNDKACIFGYRVNDPERYGVVAYRPDGGVISIEEKPKQPKSNFAVVGLYFYPNQAIEIAKQVRPSDRGELEITSVNQAFLERKKLHIELLGRGFAWLDTGTHDALLEASSFVQTVEKRQGLKVACLEEIALEKGWISQAQLKDRIKIFEKTQYGAYLRELLKASW